MSDRSDQSVAKRPAIDNSPYLVAQRQQLQAMFGHALQLQPADEQPCHRKVGPAQRREMDEQDDVRSTVWSGVVRAGSAGHAIQRRIHTFTEGEWDPGERQREGIKPFPGDARDRELFNDVTGSRGNSWRVVNEPLDSLVVKTGELETITTQETWKEWDELGRLLKTEFAAEAQEALELEEALLVKDDPDADSDRKQQAEETSVRLKDATSTIVPLGNIWFDKKTTWRWKEKLSTGRVEQHGSVSDFLKAFMGANGQLAYIRRQPWFKSGEYGIEIEVNFYPHRGFESSGGRYHKDTAGNNIFVNIIFHNDEEIPATELFKDPEEPSEKRRNLQQLLLPDAHIERLDQVRANLRRDDPQRSKPVSGGLVGKHGYASWLDDLVWHATPDLFTRPAVSMEDLMSEHLADKTYRAESYWPNVIRTLAEFSHTAAAGILHAQTLKIKELTEQQWQNVWEATYGAADGASQLEADLGKVPDQKLRFHRDRTTQVEAIAEDTNLTRDKSGKELKSASIAEQPVGLATRPRANSDAQEQERVRGAQAKQAGKTRSFIRTWVKIVKID